MNAESLDVSGGAHLWHQGRTWTVVEHDDAGATLRSGDYFKKVHGASLVGVAEPLDEREPQGPDGELNAVVHQ